MTVKISQNQPAVDSSLLTPTYDQISRDRSFDQYLEEEKKRLNALFSPFSQFNFSGLFGYAPDQAKSFTLLDNISLFADLDAKVYENNSNFQKNTATPSLENNQATPQVVSLIADQLTGQPSKLFLQQLLTQTGWLTPNLQAQPQLVQAQRQGLLLNSFNLQALVDQIADQVKLVKTKGQTQLRLGLKPANLGEILLTLTARSGMISIQIQAQDETKDLLAENLQELELALKKARINFGEIKIMAVNLKSEGNTNA